MSDRYRSDYISSWGYIGRVILWSIPVIGWIIWLANCFSRRENLRNYARSIICGLIISLIFAGAMAILGYVIISMGIITPEMYDAIIDSFMA